MESNAPPGPTMTPLAVDDCEIEFHDRDGGGEPIVLVHAGVFGSWFDPLAVTDALAPWRVILVRRAGYTTGDPPTRALSIADHAHHLAALLDHLEIDRAHVAGHSSGSAIVLQLAVDRPDLVATMSLSEPPLIDALAHPDDLDALRSSVGPVIGGAIAAAAAGDVATAYESFMEVICGPDHRTVVAAAERPLSSRRAEQQAAFFFADEILATAAWELGASTAARIDAPTQLVQGGDSPPPVHRLVGHLASMLPEASVVTIPGDNHLLPLRSPDSLADAIVAFARANPSR